MFRLWLTILLLKLCEGACASRRSSLQKQHIKQKGWVIGKNVGVLHSQVNHFYLAGGCGEKGHDMTLIGRSFFAYTNKPHKS